MNSHSTDRVTHANSWRTGISRTVVVLGVISLLQDISSEMLYPVIPIFLTTVLNAPMSVVGLIEGFAEFTAALLKAVFGHWSDLLQRRRLFVSLGYGISAASRLLLPFARAWPLILAVRLIDRLGKGVRTSPRDALLADAAPREHRGKVFGFHRALDSMGAVLGPLIAIALLSGGTHDFRRIFIVAIVPSVLAVMLTFAVRDAKQRLTAHGAVKQGPLYGGHKVLSRSVRGLPRAYWIFLSINLLFFLGNSADVFLLLRAKELGLSTQAAIFAYVVFQAVFVLFATPAGMLSDRWPRRRVMQAGFLIFALVYLGFALTSSVRWIWPLFCLYGFYAAMTDGVGKAAIVDLVAEELRGTAIGLFYAGTGIAMFIASTFAGWLWSASGAATTFYLTAAMALASAIALHLWHEPEGQW